MGVHPHLGHTFAKCDDSFGAEEDRTVGEVGGFDEVEVGIFGCERFEVGVEIVEFFVARDAFREHGLLGEDERKVWKAKILARGIHEGFKTFRVFVGHPGEGAVVLATVPEDGLDLAVVAISQKRVAAFFDSLDPEFVAVAVFFF